MHSSQRRNATHSPWAMTLRTRCTPQCPLCGEPLNPQATEIRKQLAVCSACGRTCMPGLDEYLENAIAILDNTTQSEQLTSYDRGIRFWTPRDERHFGKSLLQLYPADCPIDYGQPAKTIDATAMEDPAAADLPN